MILTKKCKEIQGNLYLSDRHFENKARRKRKHERTHYEIYTSDVNMIYRPQKINRLNQLKWSKIVETLGHANQKINFIWPNGLS